MFRNWLTATLMTRVALSAGLLADPGGEETVAREEEQARTAVAEMEQSWLKRPE
jgi:hypothetical protein